MALISSGKLFKWFDYFLIVYFFYYALSQDSLLFWFLTAFIIWRRIWSKFFIGSDSVAFHIVDCKANHSPNDGHRHHSDKQHPERNPSRYRRPA